MRLFETVWECERFQRGWYLIAWRLIKQTVVWASSSAIFRDSFNFHLQNSGSSQVILSRIVYFDETWITYYEPELRMHSAVWHTPKSPRSAKFRRVQSKLKMMAIILVRYPWSIDKSYISDWQNYCWQELWGVERGRIYTLKHLRQAPWAFGSLSNHHSR